jgi:hypothetical protein
VFDNVVLKGNRVQREKKISCDEQEWTVIAAEHKVKDLASWACSYGSLELRAAFSDHDLTSKNRWQVWITLAEHIGLGE